MNLHSGIKGTNEKTVRLVFNGVVRALLLGCCLLGLLTANSAQAQISSSIEGTVVDGQGAVLPGATIKVFSPSLAIAHQSVTDKSGAYKVSGLIPGSYEITVAKTDFVTKTVKNLEVTVNVVLRLDISMQVASASTEVTVSADTPLLETTSSSTGTTITPELINDMPINGRNYLDLLQLVPGVALNRAADAGSDSATPVLGERSGNALFLIDGLPNSDETNGGAAAQFNQDSILEFQVLTSGYKAEFGHGSGGVINVVSKSGTNSLHGGFSFFHRNYVLDSSDIKGENNPPFLLRWDPSAQIGGPLVKDKVFFFASGERITESRSLNFQYPAGLPQSLLDFEAPFNKNSLTRDTRGRFKLDEQLGSHRISEQFNYTNTHVSNFLPLSAATNLPSTRVNESDSHTMVGVTDSATFGNQSNPFLMNLYAQYRREPSLLRSANPSAGSASTLFNLFDNYSSGSEFGDLGQVTFGPGFTPVTLNQKYENFGAALAKTVGNHSIKFGWELQHLTVDGIEGNNLFDQLFATTADFNTYGPTSSGVTLLTYEGGVTPQDNLIRLHNFYDGLYAQDDWKLSSKWTINGGLRWDYDSSFPNKTNFAPRAGFAYSLNSKTVFRGSWGMFYDHFRTGTGRDIPGFGGASISRSRYLGYPRLFYGNPSTVSNLFASRGLGAPCLSSTMTDAQIAAAGTKCTFDGTTYSYPLYGIDHLNSVVAAQHAPVPANAVVDITNVQALTGYTAQEFADAASLAIGLPAGSLVFDPFGHISYTGIAAFGKSIPVSVDPRFKTPRSSAWNFGVQRQLDATSVVTLDYYHRDIYDILGVRNTNLAFEARMPGHTGELVPNTGTAIIQGYGPWYAGTYDSAVLAYKRQMSHHFSLQVDYQFTHATDDDANANFSSDQQSGSGLSFASVDNGPLDSFVGIPNTVVDANTGQTNATSAFVNSNGNPVPVAGKFYNGPAALGSGPSSLAFTHTLMAYGLVDLPYKFTITDIFRVQSGFRYSAASVDSTDVDGDGFYNGTDYTKGVNHFQAPAYSNMDIRIAKRFDFADRYRIDTYFEFYNLFNTDNPAAIQSLPDQPQPFGSKLQVLNGREGQVGVRFSF